MIPNLAHATATGLCSKELPVQLKSMIFIIGFDGTQNCPLTPRGCFQIIAFCLNYYREHFQRHQGSQTLDCDWFQLELDFISSWCLWKCPCLQQAQHFYRVFLLNSFISIKKNIYKKKYPGCFLLTEWCNKYSCNLSVQLPGWSTCHPRGGISTGVPSGPARGAAGGWLALQHGWCGTVQGSTAAKWFKAE